MKSIKVFKFIIYSLPIFIVLFCIYNYFCFSGKLGIEYDFHAKNPYLQGLGPGNRLSGIIKDNDYYYQQVLDEPIYFTVKTPVRFEKAKVEIIYQKENLPDFFIGTVADSAVSSFYFQPFDLDSPGELPNYKKPEELENGWKKNAQDFDLAKAYDFSLSKKSSEIKFVVSAPNLNLEKSVLKIAKIKVDLAKKPITFQNIFNKIKNLFN